MASDALQERCLKVSTTDRAALQEMERTQDSIPQNTVGVSGGNFKNAHFGPQTHNVKVIKKDKFVEQDYSNAHIGTVNITHLHQNIVSPTGADVKPPPGIKAEQDWINLNGTIWMYHKRNLGGQDNLYYGERRSDVTGVTPLTIKSFPISEQHIREANLLMGLRHPNVVSVVESDSYCLGPMKHMFIAMEKCQDQNLHDYVLERRDRNIPVDSAECVSRAKQLVEGLRYIHSNNIVHRDLKPHSVLVSLCGKLLKISDFGLSKVITGGLSTVANVPRVGTDGYRAPETYNSGETSQCADVFSLGLLISFYWSHGHHPFGEDSDEWNINIKRFKNLNLNCLKVDDAQGARILLEKMLGFHPKSRPTADQILDDAFFTGARHRPGSIHPSFSTPEFVHQRPSDLPQSPRQRNSPGKCLHTSESDPALFHLQQEEDILTATIQKPSLDGFESNFTDLTATSLCERLPPAIALSPPENFPRRRSKTYSTQLSFGVSQRNAVSAENSPRTSIKNGYYEMGGNVRRRFQRATAGERPRPMLPSNESIVEGRPRSVPDELHLLQTPMQPCVLHAKLNRTLPMNNNLLVFEKTSCTTRLYNPKRKAWSKLHNVPREISKQNFTAVVLGEFLYVLTGAGDVFRIGCDGQNANWTAMPKMGKNHGDRPPAVVVNGSIYVVGTDCGNSLLSMNEVEGFNPMDQRWKTLRKMECTRQNHAVVSAEGWIYCIGGQGKSMLNSVDKFCPSTGVWAMVQSMLHTRMHPAAVAFNAKIYVLGGYRAGRCESKLSSAEVYDIRSEVWSTLVQMHKPRAAFTACLLNEQIYAVGGDKKGFHEEKKTLESYNVATRKWTVIQVPKEIKMDSGSAVSMFLSWGPAT